MLTLYQGKNAIFHYKCISYESIGLDRLGLRCLEWLEAREKRI
jgi:hypothetical protein